MSDKLIKMNNYNNTINSIIYRPVFSDMMINPTEETLI